MQISFANFEYTALDNGDEQKRVEKARKQYETSYEWAKNQFLKDERVLVLDSWLEFEKSHGTPTTIEKVEKLMPKSVKKRRRVVDDEGNPTGWEEYFDHIFPEDDVDASNIKLLSMAHQWKMKQQSSSEDEDSDQE